MSEPREEFEEATKKILELTGYAMITGLTMYDLYGGNRIKSVRESFKEYVVEIMPHMDAYLIRRKGELDA